MSNNLRIHYFDEDISSDTLPKQFTYPFSYTPDDLTKKASAILRRYLESDYQIKKDIEAGKMFGVMIVKDKNDKIGFIAAFSGLLNNKSDIEYFVPPVFDLLTPEGYFKKEENIISHINKEIISLENNEGYIAMNNLLLKRKEQQKKDIEDYKLLMAQSKKRREESRKSNNDKSINDLLIKESQFQKAELKRLQNSWNEIIDNLQLMICDFESIIESLKTERKQRSAELQKRLFDSFIMLNANGETKNLSLIFEETPLKTPPSGSGECCAPKLLQYAYQNDLKPISMAEFWMGESPKSIVRKEGSFYPACTGKCGPILGFMLKGLDVEENPLKECSEISSLHIIYEDEYIVVIDKPHNLLSVPGKVSELSALSILEKQIKGRYSALYAAHRLDMATSGLLMFAKNESVYKQLQKMFFEHKIKKQYIAVIDGVSTLKEGKIELALVSDYIERPKQKVDIENGKKAVTYFKVLSEEDGKSRVLLTPVTGRTHQLRVHLSHHLGLNIPILGDELYGIKEKRLHLHSYMLSLIHPVTNNLLEIYSDPEF